ncbi:MAG: molybdopterin-dependent oxidoreductase, partial [Rhodoferax sp.]|nr:molybdopterin-dependent oxidoreductase [Rhodoferax sp.]
LGMSNRGEHAEIESFVGQSVDSELSGNMIDICPVGALTSKPFRYSARTWELSRRKSVSPHDSTGANLIVQVKNNRVMRVVPFENEAVNECWIADRDRFSYEALNGADRLTTPMIKQGGKWNEVDWKTALEYVAHGLRNIKSEHGAASIGALVSPHSTIEELYLSGALMRALGSENIDYRLRNAQFDTGRPGARWLGLPVAALSSLQSVLVVGSNLRKDHPLFAQRIRQAVRHGCVVSAVTSVHTDWAMPVANARIAPAVDWVQALADIAAAVAQERSLTAPQAGQVTEYALSVARTLIAGERKAVLLGNAAAHHSQALSLLGLANWIGEHTGAAVGYLTEAANTVGAQLVGALPGAGGLHAGQMLTGGLKAVLLVNTEPEFDAAPGAAAVKALANCEMVVSLGPFKANMDCADVLLPIAPFTETSGTFVNAEGRIQSFHAVVKPLGETRPAWKVLRALADILGLPGFGFDASTEVLVRALDVAANGAPDMVASARLNNASAGVLAPVFPWVEPCVAPIYQLDSLVRRAASLQQTADARMTVSSEVTA